MTKTIRLFGLLFLLMLGVAALGFVNGGSQAQAAPVHSVVAQACDPSGSVNGTAEPSTVTPGQAITFTVRGFTPGEELSFWFTDPLGNVVGTARPLCCAPASGTLVLPNIRTDPNMDLGRWALTFQGATSRNTAVVYFCVVSTLQATATPVPPTNTPVPPTNTPVPPTATTAAASPTAATSPTALASPTVVETIAVSPTAVPATPTGVPTSAPTSTTAPLPTEEPTAAPIPTPEPTTEPLTPPGMPRTGSQTDFTLFALVALIALGALTVGMAARGTSRAKR